MKEKTILIIGLVALLLFSGCNQITYEKVSVTSKLDNIHYNTCETLDGVEILCSKTCRSDIIQMCVLKTNPLGKVVCQC